MLWVSHREATGRNSLDHDYIGCSVQFSSFWFDDPGMVHLQCSGGFHAGLGPQPLMGNGHDNFKLHDLL